MRALKMLVVIFGSSVVVGALVLAYMIPHAIYTDPKPVTPQEHFDAKLSNPYTLSSDAFMTSVIVAGVAAVLVLALGIAWWIVLRNEPTFAADVDELWANGWIRLFGIPITAGAIGAGLFCVMELSFATPEKPPKWDELIPFAGGMAILGLMGYAAFAILAWIVRKLIGKNPETA